MKKQKQSKRFWLSLMALPMLCATLTLTACGSDNDGDGGGGIKSVIPDDIRNKMKDYITFYEGDTPPNIEGVYLASPYVYVYDSSDGGYEAGHQIDDYYIEVSNQNSNDNTCYFRRRSASQASSESGQAYIIGNGNNFTIYLTSAGTSDGVNAKRVTVVSGTKTANGIKDYRHAFVLTEKGDDPEHIMVPVGTFRVFKDQDGLAENSTWPTSARAEGALKAKRQLKTELTK